MRPKFGIPVYFDATTDRLMKSLARALPGHSLSVVDASVDRADPYRDRQQRR